jgi:signal transduction histidine kinase
VRLVARNSTQVLDLVGPGELHLRAVSSRSTRAPDFAVLTLASTLAIDEQNEALAAWFAFSTPIVVVLSLVGGYILSRRALRPIAELADQVARITPDQLGQRLPVHPRADELDGLAEQFNALLERLQRAQAQNRRFLQQAAHQIKTPLTLVLGEADLGLERPRTSSEQQQTLQRVRTAAAQMKRRVDELFLLAQAEAGERLDLSETVELDGLALECADLMRGRAHALGRRLELLRVEPISVRGNETLLREAVLELIENACRYGSSDNSIAISAFSTGSAGCVLVASPGEPVTPSPNDSARSDEAGAHGLGMAIVRWIASAHSGYMTYQRETGVNVYGLLLPALPAGG